jgi:hypothetical protein
MIEGGLGIQAADGKPELDQTWFKAECPKTMTVS